MPAHRQIQTEPTKDFFIDVLTRDIQLSDAMLDLLDNSIDAAHSLAGAEGNLSNFQVHLTVDNESFTIKDTCGGIDATHAANYAFRFGRHPATPTTKGSIGEFGVGMKRALFKLGKAFTVQSQTKTTFWSMNVDVDEWRRIPGWAFSFDQEPIARQPQQGLRPGTTITVTRLHNETRTQFDQREFIENLKERIGQRASNFIGRGLAVTVNEWPLAAPLREMLAGQELRSQIEHYDLAKEESQLPVSVHIVTGVAPSEPREAGWYVYCNGRLVLGADRSQATGWGLTEDERMPAYHNQYARFRGYANFFSENAGYLPWNTTKSNLDQGHPTYLVIRPRMIDAARPVIDFLNAVKEEQDDARRARDEGADEPDELKRALESASKVRLDALREPARFVAPIRPKIASRPTGPRTQSIQFRKPVPEINNLKGFFGVNSGSAVGERCFEYVYDEEIGDDE